MGFLRSKCHSVGLLSASASALVLSVCFVSASGCGDSGGGINGCGEERPCTDPERSFCDLYGEYPESNGVQNVCIAQPDIAQPEIDVDAGVDASDSGRISQNVRFTVAEVNFNGVAVGATSSAIVVTLKNHGDGPTKNLSLQIVGQDADQFSLDEDLCSGKVLERDEKCTVTVVVSPTAEGEVAALLQVIASAADLTTVKLNGMGLIPGELTVSTTSHEFAGIGVGTASPAEKTITVSNGGETVTTGLSVQLQDTENFGISSNDCATALQPGASCEVTVVFDPQMVGNFATTLRISANAELNEAISLQGVGMARLIVKKSGAGGGAVSDTAEINCGTYCSGLFAPGTVVQLTAAPNDNSIFEKWSGDCSGTAKTCSLTLNSDKTVTAEFLSAWTVTVTVQGEGDVTPTVLSGSLLSTKCTGKQCVYCCTPSTKLRLNAQEETGYYLKKWTQSGCSTSTCTIGPLTNNAALQVVFEKAYQLIVKVQDNNYSSFFCTNCRDSTAAAYCAAVGVVTDSPKTINCGKGGSPSKCSTYVKPGTTVALFSSNYDKPASGGGEMGMPPGDRWEGCVEGTTSNSSISKCTVTVNSEKTIVEYYRHYSAYYCW